MDVIHARCAGLEVHKQTVVACVRVAAVGRVRHEVRTFARTTAGLLALQEWLVAAVPMPRWSRRACIGSRCGTCSRTA
jgi:hypothetical protein